MHAHWDGLFGGYSSVFGAMLGADDRGGLASVPTDVTKAQILDPEAWAQESFDLAKQYAYAAPMRIRRTPVGLTRDDETNARSQAALAAARLANLINSALR
ncbi:hypothetical protein TSA1_15370 [Bradyrhizobium nitroreducens]|uniref:Uncharacterized protein n=1 Tax=Bradyrhizobium nitroreducens TaxID=709803 RepID=A0A2M6UBK4_9BRAD|nr:hypothetical protein TSA1_15370 [Bradyrhizobium nitroreducens]